MAGLFGIGGSGAKTDRKQQLKSWGELESLFGPAKATGEAQTKEGAGGLSKAANYFQTLMSGNRAQMSQLLAPQISSIKGQSAQKMATASQFGNRSGGTNAALQADEQGALTAIQNLFDLLGPEAAKEFAAISGLQEQMGLGLTDLAANVTAEAGGMAGESRKQTLPMQQAQQSAVMEGLVSLFGL